MQGGWRSAWHLQLRRRLHSQSCRLFPDSLLRCHLCASRRRVWRLRSRQLQVSPRKLLLRRLQRLMLPRVCHV